MYDKYLNGHTSMLMFISLVKIDEIHNREVNKRINKCFVIYKNVVFPNHVLSHIPELTNIHHIFIQLQHSFHVE